MNSCLRISAYIDGVLIVVTNTQTPLI